MIITLFTCSEMNKRCGRATGSPANTDLFVQPSLTNISIGWKWGCVDRLMPSACNNVARAGRDKQVWLSCSHMPLVHMCLVSNIWIGLMSVEVMRMFLFYLFLIKHTIMQTTTQKLTTVYIQANHNDTYSCYSFSRDGRQDSLMASECFVAEVGWQSYVFV